MTRRAPTYLVIGFPGAAAVEVARALAREGGAVRILADGADSREAEDLAGSLGGGSAAIEGSTERIDLGLPGSRYMELAAEVSVLVEVSTPGPPGSRPEGARYRAVREIVEIASVAEGLEHVIVLSHLDVAGDFAGAFAERDLDLGQGFPGPAAADRHRAERILRRHSRTAPTTVLRCGWVPGSGRGLCPLVEMLLALSDTALPQPRAGESRIHLTTVEDLAGAVVGLAGLSPEGGTRTLHLAAPGEEMGALANRVVDLARRIVPAGFDLGAGARRALRRGGERGWLPREFVKWQPFGARPESAWTERFLGDHGLAFPSLTDDALVRLVERAVEEIVGFK